MLEDHHISGFGVKEESSGRAHLPCLEKLAVDPATSQNRRTEKGRNQLAFAKSFRRVFPVARALAECQYSLQVQVVKQWAARHWKRDSACVE